MFDEGYPNNPRYALPFPPDNYNQAKLRYYGRYKPRPLPGSASINVNAPLLPIDTLTGLLKYTDKRHFHMTADVAKLPLGTVIFHDLCSILGFLKTVVCWKFEENDSNCRTS